MNRRSRPLSGRIRAGYRLNLSIFRTNRPLPAIWQTFADVRLIFARHSAQDRREQAFLTSFCPQRRVALFLTNPHACKRRGKKRIGRSEEKRARISDGQADAEIILAVGPRQKDCYLSESYSASYPHPLKIFGGAIA